MFHLSAHNNHTLALNYNLDFTVSYNQCYNRKAYNTFHSGMITRHILFISCRATSNEALARITPVNPPIVNNAINPRANSIGVVYRTEPP